MALRLSDQFKRDIKAHHKKKKFKELSKIWELIQEVDLYRERPLEGKGSPELLRHLDEQIYSRRSNAEDRLIYRVGETDIQLISCRGHYTNFG